LELDFTRLDKLAFPAGAEKRGESEAGPALRLGSGETGWAGDEKYGRYLQCAKAEILVGIKQGESAHSLFLKAAKAIGVITDDCEFYDRVKEMEEGKKANGLPEPAQLKLGLGGQIK